MAIKILSNDTIQKIAAGEVVENPYSVVKELVENSIDSGATNIKVEIKNAGKKEIMISDNGSGINENEIELAFTKHATSKLDKFDDLYSLFSFGFRGEALASISSVSKIDINTRIVDSELGTHCYIENSKIIRKNKIGMNYGTTIYIRDLFYNVPIRKKFLKSEVYESSIITNLMYSFAIANQNISFKYVKDGRIIFETNNKNNFNDNILEIFDMEFLNSLIPIKIDDVDYKIKGYITNNTYYRSNRSLQFLFVNNRYIYDDKIRSVMEKSIISILPKGKYPCFILFIEVNPNLIDVNIHPNKKKIKFVFEDKLINLLNSNILDIVLNNTKSPYLLSKEEKTESILFEEEKKELSNEKIFEEIFIDNEKFSEVKNKVIETDEFESNVDSIKPPILDFTYDDLFSLSEEVISEVKESEDFIYNLEKIETEQVKKEDIQIELLKKEKNRSLLSYKNLGLVFQKYVLLSDENELLVVDIVNSKYKILFEKFLEEFRNSNLTRQVLLIPIVLELTELEFEKLNKFKGEFLNLGFDIDIFDENSVIVRSIPRLFDDKIDKEDIRYIINEFSNINYLTTEEKIFKIVLKNRIKIKNLSEFEINELLSDLSKYDYDYNLFGKNIVFKISSDDFKKLLIKG